MSVRRFVVSLALLFVNVLVVVSIAAAQSGPAPQDPRNYPFSWSFPLHPVSASQRDAFFRLAKSRSPLASLKDLCFTVQTDEADEVRAFNIILFKRDGVFSASDLAFIKSQLHLDTLAGQTQGDPYKRRLGALLEQVTFVSPSLNATKQLVSLFVPYMPQAQIKVRLEFIGEFCAAADQQAGYVINVPCLMLATHDLNWVSSIRGDNPSMTTATVYIWKREGTSSIFGHVAVVGDNRTLSPFPYSADRCSPHITIATDKYNFTLDETVRCEARPPTWGFVVRLRDQDAFDIAMDKLTNKTPNWEFIPVSDESTNCLRAAYRVLSSGGLDNLPYVLFPGGLADELKALIGKGYVTQIPDSELPTVPAR
jgi:hypothetical protein